MEGDIVIDISAIIVGVIAALASVVAAFITSRTTQIKVQEQMHISDQVQNVKIEHLTEEVRKHNGFAERVPSLEADVQHLKEDVADIKRELHH